MKRQIARLKRRIGHVPEWMVNRIMILGIGVLSALTLGLGERHDAQQQEGRQVAIDALCSVDRAVVDENRRVLKGSGIDPDAYADRIADAVDRSLARYGITPPKRRADDPVPNCQFLQRAANAR